MKFLVLSIKKSITSDFLYYSWINLKNKKDSLFDSTKLQWTEPLSKSWFNKASKLIKEGNYVYSTYDASNLSYIRFSRKKLFLHRLKNKIVENAFLILIKLRFSNNLYLNNINLTECLRL